MQCVYQARDRIEAQLLLDLLTGHRIEAVVLRDSLSGAAGELPADITPALWLTDARDLERARALIEEFLNPPPGLADNPWECPACGEQVEGDFDLCWNCGRPRPRRDGPPT
jgi:hypothetical protein